MWKQQRRKKLQSTPFPPAWRGILEARVPLYGRLPEPDRRELEGHTQVFLAEKNFEGCGGLAMTEEIQVCIAAQACVLLLHRDTDYYPGLRSVLVYPGRYFAPTTRHLGAGIVEERQEARLGEAWPEGTVVLAWDAVRAGASDRKAGTNIVLHEFAHLLDFEDGWSDGAPLLDRGESPSAGRSRKASWARVLGAEFKKLRAGAQMGEEADLDVYGATNPAEFFAVATESFFERPQEMQEKHPELYEQLKGFYRQDPARWEREAGAANAPDFTLGESGGSSA
ncbi:MAG: M90 family metallopeptidase [Verrucomicrobiota bacterium]|jgi:Mlc titration factor MtfA (ptsG expression regulator)